MVLGVYGSGGAGKEVKEIAEEVQQWDEIVFIDDTAPADLFRGIRRMPFTEFQKEFNMETAEIVIALGEPAYKTTLYNRVKDAGFVMCCIRPQLSVRRRFWGKESSLSRGQ